MSPAWCLGFRGLGPESGTGDHQIYWGASLGGNFNRYLGATLSRDAASERRIHVDGLQLRVGEYSITRPVPRGPPTAINSPRAG